MPTVTVRMKEADNKLFLPNVPALKERSFGAILYMDDRFFMMRAIRLARKGIGRVSPNPRVGAVVVRDGRVLSEGFHAHFGGPHAEIAALSNLGRGKAEGAALFVNLEPCCHMGKTAPCTDAIIQAGLRRVVIGTHDPNPLVSGKGIKRLQESGIRVDVGVAEAECVRLNQGFFKYITGKG
ncbi:MAG TPA: bifunctional diaminohydroxyphosphoribosylaminopyrimidine deaminase/5-amino-6-(5-phosphoribosylamino)uracil reductase RibD, partial [bacterium]